jgi:hypothetical protein
MALVILRAGAGPLTTDFTKRSVLAIVGWSTMMVLSNRTSRTSHWADYFSNFRSAKGIISQSLWIVAIPVSIFVFLFRCRTVTSPTTGSGTRASNSGSSSSSRIRPRFATPLTHETAVNRMRDEAFDLLRPQAQTRRVEPVKMRYPDSRTHVLLAACRQDEQAWESDEGGSGLFTSALLQVLRSAELPRLSYMQLMAEIGKLPYQTPQCEGKHRNRIIFDGKALGIDKKLIPVRRSAQGGLRVEAGVSSAVTSPVDTWSDALFRRFMASFPEQSFRFAATTSTRPRIAI